MRAIARTAANAGI